MKNLLFYISIIKKKFKKVTVLVFFLLMAGFTHGQDLTLYQIHSIPQSIHLNPAINYNCRMYIELPVFSSVQFAFNSTGFGYHDFIHKGSGTQGDSLYFDLDNLSKKLKKRNYIRNDL